MNVLYSEIPRYSVDGEEFLINPNSFFADNKGAPVVPWHTGNITEHADAFLYYASFGLLDPKMPLEAVAIRKTMGWLGWRGLLAGAGVSMSMGMAGVGLVLYAFDPADLHSSGIMQTQAWDRFTTGDWFGL